MTPKNTQNNGQSVIRKMGISLFVLGTVVTAMGAVALRQGPSLRNILLPAFGIALCASGFYTWRNAKD